MPEITLPLVRQLLDEQFPKWRHLPLWPVAQSGHDNRTFHLGDELAVRLPSGPAYAPQAEKEARFLPYLAGRLTLPISEPVAIGKPTDRFPYPWSVNRYLPGETAREVDLRDSVAFAGALAAFLRELQGIDASGGPAPGSHNCYRGVSPAVYQQQTLEALDRWKGELPADGLRALWDEACATAWDRPPVWIHGDIAPGNLLTDGQTLTAVIDFGILGTGDPACDYAMAWTYFTGSARAAFLEGLPSDVVARARAWALWKALITHHGEDAASAENAADTLAILCAEAGLRAFC